MYSKSIDKIQVILNNLGYKKVGRTVFYKSDDNYIKIIKIRKHTILEKFFVDIGVIIKSYRKKQNKMRENTWSLSCNPKNITNNNLYKGVNLQDFFEGKIDLSNDFIAIDSFLANICNLKELKSLVISKEIYKYCMPMPLGIKTDIEFEKFILSK